jgi:Protein of unknown function (DUF4246)
LRHRDNKHNERRVNLRREYTERGLQDIVKLVNIHLTLEKPSYGCGTWYVEGQLLSSSTPNFELNDYSHKFLQQNEHIALYYYDVNITESRLSFRQQTADTTRGAQGQARYLLPVS